MWDMLSDYFDLRALVDVLKRYMDTALFFVCQWNILY
jgi:hypothetical protein